MHGSSEFCGEKHECKHERLFVLNLPRRRWSSLFGPGGLYRLPANTIKSSCSHLVVSTGISQPLTCCPSCRYRQLSFCKMLFLKQLNSFTLPPLQPRGTAGCLTMTLAPKGSLWMSSLCCHTILININCSTWSESLRKDGKGGGKRTVCFFFFPSLNVCSERSKRIQEWS